MHVAPGAASDSCNFHQPTVLIFSMAGCGNPLRGNVARVYLST
jgi:hypothetical protein